MTSYAITKIPPPLNFIIGITTKKEAVSFFHKHNESVSGIYTTTVNGFDKTFIDKSFLTMELFEFDSAVLYFDKKTILRRVNFYFKDFLRHDLKEKAIEAIKQALPLNNHQSISSHHWKTNKASIKLNDIGLVYIDNLWFALLDKYQEASV